PFHLGDMTMKVLCISKWAKAPSPEERDAILPKEVPATLKLYLDGVIEQMWFKLDAPGVVFLVNAESIDAAKTPRAWPADGPSRADGLRLHPGRAAGSARHADRRKGSVAGAADMTSVPILIGGAAGATGSVATKLLLGGRQRLLDHWPWTLSSTRKPYGGPSPNAGGGPENASDSEERVRRP